MSGIPNPGCPANATANAFSRSDRSHVFSFFSWDMRKELLAGRCQQRRVSHLCSPGGFLFERRRGIRLRVHAEIVVLQRIYEGYGGPVALGVRNRREAWCRVELGGKAARAFRDAGRAIFEEPLDGRWRAGRAEAVFDRFLHHIVDVGAADPAADHGPPGDGLALVGVDHGEPPARYRFERGSEGRERSHRFDT